MQILPTLPARAEAQCHRCDKRLTRTAGRSVDAAWACALGMVLLSVPAAFLPVMHVTLIGMTAQMGLISTVSTMVGEGHFVVAAIIAVLTLLLPFVRGVLLSVVLGALRFGRTLPNAGRAFRWAETLAPWAVLEVLSLGLLVTYMRMRLRSQIEVEVGLGGYALAGAAVLGLAGRLLLDRGTVWRAIGAEPALGSNEKGIACDACELAVPAARAGEPCPRCARTLAESRPARLGIVAALVVTCYLLFLPSYIYPMSHVDRPEGAIDRTIFSGIATLFGDGMWYFALFFITVSVVFPLVKLLGLTWILLRVRFPTPRGLVLRTKLMRFIRAIGPWQFTDPLVVATTTPLISFPIARIHGAFALLPFSLFVVCTMLAAELLDTRLMWQAAEETTTHE